MMAMEYDLTDGRFGWSISSDTPFDDYPVRDGFGLVDGHYDPAVYYVDITADPPAAVERPTQGTILSGSTLTGLPIPATLYVNGEAHVVDDGEAELDILLPGTYRLRVEAWPYKEWEGEVTV